MLLRFPETPQGLANSWLENHSTITPGLCEKLDNLFYDQNELFYSIRNQVMMQTIIILSRFDSTIYILLRVTNW